MTSQGRVRPRHAEPEPRPLIAAKGLVFWPASAKRPVLGPLDLAVQPAETVAVIGPNGAGKTTLLRLLGGLLTPTSGDVAWRQRPLLAIERRELARSIAYLPQARPLEVPFTVEETVMLGRYPYLSTWQGAPNEADFAALELALERTGITSLRHRHLDLLSGGERQLVYLASALAQEPELLLLDEPTTHLDPRHQADLAAVLAALAAAPGGTGRPAVVLTSHDLAFAALSSRVVALREGLVVADGPPSEVLRAGVLREIYGVAFAEATSSAPSAVPHVLLAGATR